MSVTVRPVASKADREAFVELAYRLNLADPNWVPPLKDEVRGLITPGKNPWFEHAEAAFFLAFRRGRRDSRSGGSRRRSTARARAYGRGARPVGDVRGRGRGDGAGAARRGRGLAARQGDDALDGALLARHLGRAGAADRGPRSSADGDDGPQQAPNIRAGSRARAMPASRTSTPTTCRRRPAASRRSSERIIASGEKNARIRIRQVDKSRFDEEAALILVDPQRGLVGQLGLHPADRRRDRLCRQEAEADRARGHDPGRRI